MNRRLMPLLVAGLMSAATPDKALAQTTNLFPVADVSLTSSDPNGERGEARSVHVGVSNFGSPINRDLFKFGLTSIPTNAIVTKYLFSEIGERELRR